MIDNILIDNFKANESICDLDVLKKIINVLDYDTVCELQKLYYEPEYYDYYLKNNEKLSESEETLYRTGYEITSSLEKQLKHLKYVPKQFHENETVDQLLTWFNDSKSRKVDYARKRLQSRFQYLSFVDQNRIIYAFLNKENISDTAHCCYELFKNDVFWQDCYLPYIERFFLRALAKKPRIAYMSVKSVIKHFSKEFILSCINSLDVPDLSEDVRFVLQLLLPAIDEHPNEVLKNVVLRPDEYVYIMSKKGLKVTETEAAQALNLLLDLEVDDNIYDKKRIKIKTITWSVARMGYFELLFDFGAKLKAKYSNQVTKEIIPNPDSQNFTDIINPDDADLLIGPKGIVLF